MTICAEVAGATFSGHFRETRRTMSNFSVISGLLKLQSQGRGLAEATTGPLADMVTLVTSTVFYESQGFQSISNDSFTPSFLIYIHPIAKKSSA